MKTLSYWNDNKLNNTRKPAFSECPRLILKCLWLVNDHKMMISVAHCLLAIAQPGSHRYGTQICLICSAWLAHILLSVQWLNCSFLHYDLLTWLISTKWEIHKGWGEIEKIVEMLWKKICAFLETLLVISESLKLELSILFEFYEA